MNLEFSIGHGQVKLTYDGMSGWMMRLADFLLGDPASIAAMKDGSFSCPGTIHYAALKIVDRFLPDPMSTSPSARVVSCFVVMDS